jgi:hypothetical protein
MGGARIARKGGDSSASGNDDDSSVPDALLEEARS